MKRFISVLLMIMTACLLGGCGITQKAGDASLGTAQAETRAQRIQSYSKRLDEYESLLDGIDYGRSVKSALKKAQKAENTAIANQNDNGGTLKNLNPWDWDGDKACDEFEKAVNSLGNAMNKDSAVRAEVERQNSVAADNDTKDIFGGAWKKYLMLFMIFAAVLILIILALAVLRKSKHKSKVKEVTIQPLPDTKPEPKIIDVEASEVREVDTNRRQANLLETSRARFERECEALGHDPDEVLEYFGGDEKKAKVYISMEVNLRNQGGDKDYKQIYEEAAV